MTISYQIIDFNESHGSITVAYKNNGESFATYNIDVPLDANNNFIVGSELDAYITNMFPTAVLNRMETLKKGVPNAANIQALVVAPQPAVPTTPTTV